MRFDNEKEDDQCAHNHGRNVENGFSTDIDANRGQTASEVRSAAPR
jgi:hypothetical protein